MSYPTRLLLTASAALLASAAATPVLGQTTASGTIKVAVIDVRRLVTDSAAGKEVLAALQRLSEEKSASLKVLADELEGLQTQINDGRLSLSEARLSELKRQLEDQTIAFRRARDDADRQLQELQAERFTTIEDKVMPIINEVGVASGYTMIFNKYESGLVFAQETVDITDLILQRFDAATAAAAAAPSEGDGT